MQKIWKLKDADLSITQDIIEEAGSLILAKLLVSRGFDTVSKISNFLNPLKMKLSHYDAFVDIEKSVERVRLAIAKGENITVYGDFDADGITSTAVLYKTLKEIGANVSFYIPNRESESHGLNTKALVNIISKNKSKLIITVDCGISNVQEINFANGFKTDVIITDHHEAPEIMPSAYAIINPKAPDALKEDLSLEEIESLSYLAGVGVVFKFCCGLLQEFNKENFVDDILPLVAVGTISDVVSLLGENRCYVNMGLALIRKSKNPGLTKLLKSAGVADVDNVNSETIAFMVAPRLNAAGRLDSADKALRLLISEDEEELDESVILLNEFNKERQSLCDNTYKETVSAIKSSPDEYRDTIILYNPDWHIGIVGIVASKLVEKYNIPVFLMTKENSDSNELRCSCRSVKSINIHDILSAHASLFSHFGGHSMAGGFALDETKVSFDEIKKLLNDSVCEAAETTESSQIFDIDLELEADDVDLNLISEIEKLEPFGACNEYPVFALKNLILTDFKFMGQNSNHLKMVLACNNSKKFECVKWNTPKFNLPLSSRLDIAFCPKLNHFNGKTTIQLDIKEIQSEELHKTEDSGIKIFDHRRKSNILEQVFDYIVTSGKKISLFVESRKTQECFNGNQYIEEKIFNRNNIPKKSDHIMFFDCPPDENMFREIVSLSSAKALHFMNFDSNFISAEDFIKTLSGMLKFAGKNKNGVIKIGDIARVLNVTSKTVDIGLKLFDALQMIKAEKIDAAEYRITFNSSLEFSKIRESGYYNDLENEINKIREFRKIIYKADVEELQKMLAP